MESFTSLRIMVPGSAFFPEHLTRIGPNTYNSDATIPSSLLVGLSSLANLSASPSRALSTSVSAGSSR